MDDDTAGFTKGSHMSIKSTKFAMTLMMSMAYLSAGAQMTISGTPPSTATVGEQYDFVPVVHDANDKELQFNYVNRPAWSGDYRGSGAIIGTPTQAGVYVNIQIQAWDGEHFATTAPFTISVLAAEDAPIASAGSAAVSWEKPTQNTDGTPLTDLAGYIVRYGTDSAELSSSVTVTSPNTTALEISSLSPGDWYFAVAAVNAMNVESELSRIVNQMIP
jgi:hypothetical protein